VTDPAAMTCAITPADVYGDKLATIIAANPLICAFRPPLVDETYVGDTGRCYKSGPNVSKAHPRFILTTRKRYIFEETGERRVPRVGDWFKNTDYCIFLASGDYGPDAKYTILTLTEETI
jgi:hypothetical protein